MGTRTTFDGRALGSPIGSTEPAAPEALGDEGLSTSPILVLPPLPAIRGYELLGATGSGGMGVVYEAIELATERKVALKLVRPERHGLAAAERLLREVQALSLVDHPGIVQYVGHGVSDDGIPYLTMEWLEGLDLEARLQEGPLRVEDVMTLAIRAAGALAAAHRHGIIHRDIKPANIFLVGGRVEDARLLDFGVARLHTLTWTLTIPGGLIGTPGYMSPEQARGAGELDARADLFSLGCVLYECLCGQPPFTGEHVMAVLAKVLMDEPQRVRELAPGVSHGLDELVARLLEKEPSRRLPSAQELELRLLELRTDPSGSGSPATEALTRDEQRFRSVLFFRSERGAPVDFAHLAEQYLGRPVTLIDGTRLIYMDGSAVASDQAAAAARCALALRERSPHCAIAVVSGQGVVTGRSLGGRVLDRGAELLLRTPHGHILIDDVTTSLLDTGFEVEGDEQGLELVAVRDVLPGARLLMGKATPLVGRRRELAVLEAAIDEHLEGSHAGAVVVIGDAGMGKSRLRHELDDRLRARADPSITMLIGRADPMRTQAPFSLMARTLYHAAGLKEGEPAVVRQHKLRARLSRHVANDEVERVTLYLGEIASTFSRDAPLEIALARESSVTMRARIQAAWCTWLRAECDAGPVVLVLEDLHWGDAATVQAVDATLEALEGSPLLVLALARPSIRERFPELWRAREVEEIELAPLTPRASRELVRGVLGSTIDPADVERIVSGARGNTFFLEELMRAVVSGTSGELPDSVLGMMQARLDRLSVPERQVLRAASVFGQATWRGGLRELVGSATEAETLGSVLERLVRDEWLIPRDRSQIPREQEYAFRHALVCDAAYATLTDHDRRLGHRLAGQWLERAGVHEAMMLAEHFRRGDEPSRATEWFASAADQAFERHEFDVVQQIVERSLELAPASEARGRLLLRRAEVFAVSGQHHEAAEAALAALAELPPDSSRWYSAAGEAALASGRAGETSRVTEIVDLLMTRIQPLGGAVNFVGLVRAVLPLAAAGQTDEALRLLDKIVHVTSIMAEGDPEAIGPRSSARALRAIVTGNLGAAYHEMGTAASAFERTGSIRNAIEHWVGAGFVALELGNHETGETVLRRTIEEGTKLGLEHVCAVARHNLGRRIGETGRVAEGLELEQKALTSFERHGNQRMMGLTRCHMAWILLQDGRPQEAAVQVEQALGQLEAHPACRAIGLATRAQIRLRELDFAAALEDARASIEGLESLGQLQEGESLIRLTWAEALAAAGHHEQARAAIGEARRRLEARAERILDPTLRASFLDRVAENARIVRLSREWHADGWPGPPDRPVGSAGAVPKRALAE